MKPVIAILSLLLFFSNASFAQEYGVYDPRKILTVSETNAGKKYGLDLQYLDQIISDLSLHARNYPPKFDSESDQQRAIKDTQTLSGMLDPLVNNPQASPALLRRTSLLHSIGHNLDIPGATQKADRDFRNLLKQHPDDAAANFAYGAFLGGSNQGGKALPYLEKSAKAGYSNAYYSLGMAYLMQNNTELALKNFAIYKRHTPNDQSVVEIMEAIKNGSIHVNSK
jgi:tetratricopeptide (TPR) repeat protein